MYSELAAHKDGCMVNAKHWYSTIDIDPKNIKMEFTDTIQQFNVMDASDFECLFIKSCVP